MVGTNRSGQDHGWADWAETAAVFLALFLLYLLTLLPGLGGTEDTPKFQYIGAVLGTAHDPGYPLYTMLTHAWSRIPFGTLAYRINMFSAFWGASACAFVFLAMRRLEVDRWVALGVACAMGLGRTFWQHSVIAEVYTLAAALTAASVLMALCWDESRLLRWLYAAVALASLAFGAHLIFVGCLPALVLFVLERFRWRLPWRVAVVSALIVTAGISQYGYVWARTVQHSEYLESRAGGPRELLDVMRGRQFESVAFKEPPMVVVTKRVPAVLKEVRAETGWAGFAFAVIGSVLLFRRQRGLGALLAGAIAGQVLLLAMLGDVAVGGIALSAVALLWILAGYGIDGLRRALRSRTPVWLASAAAAGVAVSIAAVLGVGNYTENNHRNDTYDTDYMRVLFDSLPPKAAIVAEHYTLDHMVEYQKVVTRCRWIITSVPPTPDRVEPLLEQGISVFAFGGGRDLLARRYVMKPVELFGLTLDERLRTLEPGRVVILSGTADPWPAIPSLGLVAGGAPHGRAVVIAVKDAGIVARTPDGFDGQVTIPAGQMLGDTGVAAPADIMATATGGRAEIRIGGESVVESRRGLVIVEMGSHVHSAYAALPEQGMRVPMQTGRRPLFEVGEAIRPESCAEVGRGDWVSLKQVEGTVLSGYLDNRRPALAGLDLYVASTAPLRIRLGDYSGTGTPGILTEQLRRESDGGNGLAARLLQDHVPPVEALLSARVVARVAVTVNDKGQFSVFDLLLGGVPSWVIARGRVDVPEAPRAIVCAPPAEPLNHSVGLSDTRVYLGPGGDSYFGWGWGHIWPTAFGYERELSDPEADLVLPLEKPSPVAVSIRLGGAADGGTAELLVNGQSLGTHPYSTAWNTLDWATPAAAWIDGLNRVTLRIRGGALPRVRRISLASLQFDPAR
jgi:hypothetical protein